jgi:hypothetical protein
MDHTTRSTCEIATVTFVYTVYAVFATVALVYSANDEGRTFYLLVPIITNSLHMTLLLVGRCKGYKMWPVEPVWLYVATDMALIATVVVCVTMFVSDTDNNVVGIATNAITLFGELLCMRKAYILASKDQGSGKSQPTHNKSVILDVVHGVKHVRAMSGESDCLLFRPYTAPGWCSDRTGIVYLASFVWLCIDLVVISQADSNTMAYLTNQVWVLGMAVRYGLVAVAFARSCSDKTFQSVERVLASFWLIFGAAQWGVMLTFFTLVLVDDGTLDNLINEEGHSPSTIMVWNHARHVTPVILHTIITWEKRTWLQANTHIHCVPQTEYGPAQHFPTFLTYWGTLFIPILVGGVHTLFFDDRDIYQYRANATRGWCALSFVFVSCIAAKYLMYIGGQFDQVGIQPCMQA